MERSIRTLKSLLKRQGDFPLSHPSVTHSTIVIEKLLPAPRHRVFAAFSDPAKKCRWFAEGDASEVQHFSMDFRVDGKERTVFRSSEDSPLKGAPLTNDTVFQDIVPAQRIVLAYRMTVADRPISASLATFDFLEAPHGTLLIFTDQVAFFEGGEGAQIREQGWRELLAHLEDELSR